MSAVKIAVVGVGALGRHHARILAEMQGVELVAVSDLNVALGEEIAQQNKTEFVPDFRELFDRVDAVSIAVPTSGHLKIASEFLEHNIPVMVEKPLASNLEEATCLVDLSVKNDTILQVGHVERFNPTTETMSQFCGAPKYIRAERLSPYSFRSTDIGVVHDLMIHDIDLILSLVQSPILRTESFGVCIMGGHEDSVQSRLTFENGCIADLTASRLSPTAARTMQVWSHLGCVTADFTSREVICFSPSETTMFGTPPVDRAKQPGADIQQLKDDVFEKFIKVHRPLVSNDDALTKELRSFTDCVINQSRPVVDGHQALLAMTVAEQIVENVAAHQWDGHINGAIGPHAHQTVRRKLAG